MMLAKGMTNFELAKAYFAKRDTSSGGRQMPGHPSSRVKNIWSVPTPTASNLLPACGAAWAMKMQGRQNVVVATTGDAASRQGEFYEAVAFANERKLPVLFVVEDNRYGISTNTDKFNPFKLKIFHPECGIVHVNGRDPNQLTQHRCKPSRRLEPAMVQRCSSVSSIDFAATLAATIIASIDRRPRSAK